MPIYSMEQARTQAAVSDFIRGVYNWMGIGLVLTAVTAMMVASNTTLLQLIFGNRLIFFGLIIAELALVFSISARVRRMQASTATALFVLYAILNGATLSVIFLAYTKAVIANTFFVCAGMFIATSVYAMTTKRDLSAWGSFLFMGLIGIIIASVVNLFVRSSAMTMMVSYLGVIVFVGLTAYDTQKLKAMAAGELAVSGAELARKGAIIGALALYLDFVNLFLMLLRIFGGSRE
ncbi:MAG: hypothetical protein AUK55_05070 [Syntrophobacteraceae bacterium CG2_30_61_12]|nr:MAG: hypothetical protein AUK55_05070 [Syntrophobacteraceae bacterium CG2_30_61_12]